MKCHEISRNFIRPPNSDFLQSCADIALRWNSPSFKHCSDETKRYSVGGKTIKSLLSGNIGRPESPPPHLGKRATLESGRLSVGCRSSLDPSSVPNPANERNALPRLDPRNCIFVSWHRRWPFQPEHSLKAMPAEVRGPSWSPILNGYPLLYTLADAIFPEEYTFKEKWVVFYINDPKWGL